MSQRPRGEIWKSNQKVVTDEKINPKILMDEKSWKTWESNRSSVMKEELVQNSVMNETFVKNFVMSTKIDPKVVMVLSIFSIGGWNSLHPINQKMLEEFIDEYEPWLLIGIPSRDPFLLTQYLERHSVSSDQHTKKLMSRREGLHVMMQCYMRQHFADRYWLHEHPGGHASWRELTIRKFTKESTTYFVKGPVLCADGMFRRCDQNRENMFGKQRVSLQTVGESK